MPAAVNCCVALGATDAVDGVTAMDFSGLVTVSVVVPVTPPELAVIVLVPPPTPVARPEMLMVATDELDDSQLAVEVRFLVLPSL